MLFEVLLAFFLNLSLLTYFERDRDSVSGEGAEREGERERIPSRLHAVSAEPDGVLNS